MADNIQPLVQAQAKVFDGLAAALVRALLRLWDGTDWYSDADVEEKVLGSAQLVEQAQRQARTHINAYHRDMYRRMGLEFPDPEPGELDAYPRHDVTPEQVWERPAVAYRYARSQGATPEDAEKVAIERIERLADSEVVLAQRDQASRTYARTERVTGYRRIIHPELSRSGTCGLCVVAADRIYSTDDLLPIHDGCHCTTAPITKSNDPGLSLNSDDLKRIYAAAGSTGQSDLSNVRVQEYVSGELGPILTTAGKLAPEKDAKPAYAKTDIKPLSPRERAAKVTGKTAKKASKPVTPAEMRETFEKRLEYSKDRLEALEGVDEFRADIHRKNIKHYIDLLARMGVAA